MPKKDEHAKLIETLADAGGSVVTADNVKKFDYTNSYTNPVTRQMNHVFTHDNGTRVILNDDATVYATLEAEVTEEAAPRERGTPTPSMETLVKVRGSDASQIQSVEGQPVAPPQPQPTQVVSVPDNEPTTPAIENLDTEVETE